MLLLSLPAVFLFAECQSNENKLLSIIAQYYKFRGTKIWEMLPWLCEIKLLENIGLLKIYSVTVSFIV